MSEIGSTAVASAKDKKGDGDKSAQQQRLQQMIAMQHSHSDSMRQGYITRTSGSNLDDDTKPAGRTFASTERGVASERSPPRRVTSPHVPANPNISQMDPSLLTSMSMATPTLSNVSLAAAASSTGNSNNANANAGTGLPRNNSRGGGRTAEYAKRLPGGARDGSNGKTTGGNIHYQDYSQHRQQASNMLGNTTSLGQSLQQPSLHHEDSSQFHDAASHVSNAANSYGSAVDFATNNSTSAAGYEYYQQQRPAHTMMASNFNIISSQSSQHQFHYGDPSQAFDHHNHHGYSYEFPYHHGQGHHDPFNEQCVCCSCCRSCCPNVLQIESLHRSLCFGAIDGMLTGSGITAACAGLGILTTSSASSALWAVVALCLAACASDGVCMCFGHIFSTYVLTRAGLAEKREEKENFARDRSASKARLVDMLLDRGMLKIDAMSIADTLEGYPDIFVSALVGDAGALGPGSGGSMGGSAENLRKVTSSSSAGALGVAHNAALSSDNTRTRGAFGGRSSLHYASYGQFDEFKDDPDKGALRDAMKDGWNEGLIMMLSFSAFSVVPSFCFLLLSRWIPYNPDRSYESGSGDTSLTSAAICVLSTIMLLLGIWKSRFFDSHWVLFGIEAVLVLLASLVVAYSIGASLKYHFNLELAEIPSTI